MSKETPQPPKREPRPKRQAVTVLVHADGFLQGFADDNIDIHFAFVPDCEGHEVLAEEVAELMMPPKFRAVYREDKLRATGIARKYKPSALLAARQTAVDIARLNGINRKGRR